ncbi:MAG: hypothetical protein E7324_04985 [Clostridiales bacterium]|nr:hypothetical protein [Clostridiales bacterium]
MKRIGFILGDPAGIGPEVIAKAIQQYPEGYTPVLIGCRALYEQAFGPCPDMEFYDVPARKEIVAGHSTPECGRIAMESMLKAVELSKNGAIDAVMMGPITKSALDMASKYDSELPLFQEGYGNPLLASVVQGKGIYRASATGHIPFSAIPGALTQESVIRAARRVVWALERTREGVGPIAVAALNPHAGDGGMYGDEEERVLTPAILHLQQEGLPVSGPYPADTVFTRALRGDFRGVVFLYHDQGNIAMKSAMFGEGVVIYAHAPCPVVSVGHGSALDIAGKNIADPSNTIECIRIIKEMLGCS